MSAKKITTQANFLKENPEYEIIFNCLGFGSIEFCNDEKMIPIRGQMIRVKAPCINTEIITFYFDIIFENINNNTLVLIQYVWEVRDKKIIFLLNWTQMIQMGYLKGARNYVQV